MMGNLRTYYNFSLFKLGFFIEPGLLWTTCDYKSRRYCSGYSEMRWLGLDWTVSNATISCPSDSYGTFTNGETTCA